MADNVGPLTPTIDPELIQRMVTTVGAHLAGRTARLNQNLARVTSLTALATTLADDPASHNREDVLRAAVVLLHSAVEDFLRGIAASHLPAADEAALNDVPLAGSGSSGRPEKFFLGKLSMHRGKTVDQVITESVEQYLQQSNFNNSTEVAALLKSLGLDITQVQKTFAKLDQLMKRRHQIVHRADRVTPAGGGAEMPQPITPEQVTDWTNVVVEFHKLVLTSLSLADIQAGRIKFDFQLLVTASAPGS